MLKTEVFKQNNTTSGVGDLLRQKVNQDFLPTPDLSYTDALSNYDQMLAEKRKTMENNATHDIEKPVVPAESEESIWGSITSKLNGFSDDPSNIVSTATDVVAHMPIGVGPVVKVAKTVSNIADELPKDYSLYDYTKDAIATWLNAKDDMSIQTVRHDISLDLEPRKELAKVEVYYTNLEREYNRLRDAALNGDKDALVQSQEIQSKLLDMQPMYRNAVAQRLAGVDFDPEAIGSDVHKFLAKSNDERFKSVANDMYILDEKLKERYTELNDLKKGIRDREQGTSVLFSGKLPLIGDFEIPGFNHKVSDTFTENEKNTPVEFTDTDSWLWKLPSIAGSSAALMEYQLYGMAGAFSANMARTAVLRTAANSTMHPQIVGATNLAANLIAIGGVGAQMYAALTSRERESAAELISNFDTYIESNAAQAGIDLSKIIQEGREYLDKVKPEIPGVDLTEDIEDKAVLDLMTSGTIPSKDKKFNNLRAHARKNLDNLFYQNMALAASDVAQQFIAFPFVGSMVKSAVKPLTKIPGVSTVTKVPNTVAKTLNKGVDNIIEFGTKVAPKVIKDGKSIRAFGKHIGGGALRLGGVGISEAYEEGIQYVQGKRFVEDYYADRPDANLMTALWDNATAVADITLATTGIGKLLGLGDPALRTDSELYESMHGGAMLGIGMGGVAQGVNTAIADTKVSERLGLNSQSDIVNYMKQLKANTFVRNLTADQMKAKEDFDKVRMYADASISNKSEEVLQALEWTKTSLPEGITVQDIDREKQIAQDTFRIANAEATKKLANSLNINRTSEKYKDLVAASSYAKVRANDELAYLNRFQNVYNVVYNTPEFEKHIDSSVGNEADPLFKAFFKDLVVHKTQENAVQQLYNTIEQNELAANALMNQFGTSFGINANNLAQTKERLSNLLSEFKVLNKAFADQLSEANANFTLAEVDPFISPLTETNNPTLLYQNLILNKMSYEDAAEISNAFSGFVVKNGKPTKLSPNNPEANNEIVAKVKAFIDNLDAMRQETLAFSTKLAEQYKAENVTTEENLEEPTTKIPDETESPTTQTTEETIVEDVAPTEQTTTETTTVTQATEPAQEQVVVDETLNEESLISQLDDLLRRATTEDVAEEVTIEDIDIQYKHEVLIDEVRALTENLDTESKEVVETKTLDEKVEETDTEELPQTEIPSEGSIMSTTDLAKTNEFAKLEDASSNNINNAVKNCEISNNVLAGSSDESTNGLVRRTAMYDPTATTPLLDGYSPGYELSDLLSNPDNQEYLEYEYIVREDWGDFKPEDPTTWNGAAVVLSITDRKSGKKYAAALRTPNSAAIFYNRFVISGKRTQETADADIQSLTEFRNKIIAMWINAKKIGAKVVPTNISLSSGEFNPNINEQGLAINRPIAQVKGFRIPEDPYAIDNGTVELGYGTGARGEFKVVGNEGQLMPGQGGSGTIYLYTKYTPNGKVRQVKLNKRKFSHDNAVVELIYDLFVNKRANKTDYIYVNYNGRQVSTSITANEMLNLMLYWGKQTILSTDEQRQLVPHNIPKQIDYNPQTDVYQLGDMKYHRSHLLNDANVRKQFKDQLANDFVWSFDKNVLWDKIGNKLGDIRGYFYATNAEKLVIIPGLVEFDAIDVGLIKDEDGNYVDDPNHPGGVSFLSWYAKNGILQSDLKDQPFRAPFIYTDDVTYNEPVQESPQPQNGSPINDPEISLDDILGKATTDEVQDSNLLSEEEESELYDEFDKFNGIAMKTLDLHSGKKLNKKQKSIDISKAKTWLNKKLGLTEDDVIITSNVIKVANSGVTAMGLTREASIVLWEGAIDGVEYHEAFHRVNLLLHSPEERAKIYEQRRKKLNDYTSSNETIEEGLAEGFREWMSSRTARFGYYITRAFRKMFSFIDAVKNLQNNDIRELYYRISKGEFSDVPVNPLSKEEFKQMYPEGSAFNYGTQESPIELRTIPTVRDFYDIIDTLKAVLFQTNKVVNMEDLNRLNYKDLRNKIEMFSRSRRLTESQRAVLVEVLEHFDTLFAPELSASLTAMGLREIDRSNNDRMDNLESENVVGGEIANYDKKDIQVSKKKNALLAAKMFMATVVESRFEFINGVKTVKAVINPLTGLNKFVDFDTSWNIILNNLSDVDTFEQLVERTGKLAETNPFFAVVHRKLTNGSVDENLATQLLVTIKSHNQNMIYLGYESVVNQNNKIIGSKFVVGDSNTLRAKKMYPILWGHNFVNNTGLVSAGSEGFTINKDAINEILKKYDRLVDDANANRNSVNQELAQSLKLRVVNILNSVGIDVDIEVLDHFMENTREVKGATDIAKLYTMLTQLRAYSFSNSVISNLRKLKDGKPLDYVTKGSKRSVTKKVEDIYTQESFTSALAISYATVHPRPEELSVLGPDGNLLYTKTQNNYLSDMVRWLTQEKNPQILQNLLSVPYNKGSKLLNAIKSGVSIQLNNFVNFTELSSGDRGRDYTSISPLENYISKMTLLRNNHMVLPTMADKGTYYTISGIELFHKPLTFSRENGKQTLMLDNNILQQFVRYADDEWRAIKKFYDPETIELLTKDPSRKVKNYHTKKLGGRFRHLREIYMMTPSGKIEKTNLNTLLDDAEKSGTIQETIAMIDREFFKKDSNFKMQAINHLLKQAIRVELKTASNLGLIKYVDNGENALPTLSNILLDAEVFSSLEESYKNSNDPALNRRSATMAIYDMFADYTINYMVSLHEFEKVFSKDSAYYKDPDDVIKRAGGLLSTGDNLRIFDKTKYTTATLSDNEVISRQKDAMYEAFKRSYIHNYMIQLGEANEENIHELIDNPSAEVLALAEAKAKTAAKGYFDGSINQADAQVMISPEMYKAIVRGLGEWSADIEAAFDMMESGFDWLSNPDKYSIAIKTLMKPLKMTSFNDVFDPELGLAIPIYDKMALFPMFKVIATGANKELYDRMLGIGEYAGMQKIDMLKFESAVKAGVRSTTAAYTDNTNTKLGDFKKLQVYPQEMKYLRRQLLTDPHHEERQKLGTQVAKAALGNIVKDRIYGVGKVGVTQMRGDAIISEVMHAINALSNKGRDNLLREVGEIVNGDFILNVNKLSAMLQKDAKASGLPADVIDGLGVENGDFKIPLSALSDDSWIASRFIAEVGRNTVDINLPGGAFIQMSSFGMATVSVVNDGAYNNGKPLLNLRPDGSMESIVSINLLKHIIPEPYRKSHKMMRDWLIENNIIGPDSTPQALGYRIPTQGLSSIAGLTIVDVLPETIGDVIILPDEFTKQTGSDFDVDKLYIARYNYEDGKRIEFKEQLSEDALNAGMTKWEVNSQEAIENHLLDMYLTIITDSSNVNETRMPLDNATEYLKNVVLKRVDGNRKETANSPYYFVSPTYHLNKFYEYAGGKTGLAPFALNNVHHVLTQISNLKFKDHPVLLQFSMTRLDRIDSFDKTGSNILEWFNAMISAHVDVAKDPYVIRLGINQWTYNMANLLLRTGIGENTFYFLPQPILKDMSNKVAASRGRYGIDRSKSVSALERDSIESVYTFYENAAKAKIEEVKKTDKVLAKTLENKLRELNNVEENGQLEVDNTHVLRDDAYLIEQLRKKNENELDFDYYYNQLLIYKTYEQLDPFAKGLSELVHTTQIDTKKYGNNFMLLKSFLYRIKASLINNKVFHPKDVISMFKNTFLDTKIKNSILLVQELFDGVIIQATPTFSKVHDQILISLGQLGSKNDRIINSVANAIEAAYKSEFFNNQIKADPYNYFYGKNTMSKRLLNIKSDILSGKYPELIDEYGKIKNEFLNYISSRPGDSRFDGYDSPDYITTNAINLDDNNLKNKLKSYWQELLDSKYPEIVEFAEDLVNYAFLTTGDNKVMHGFFDIVPVEYKKKIGYTDFIRTKTMELNTSRALSTDMSFVLDDVLLNNYHDSNLVPDVKFSKTYRTIDGYVGVRVLPHVMSAIPLVDGTEYPFIIFDKYRRSVGFNQNDLPVFPKYVKYNIDMTKNPTTTVVYKYIGIKLSDWDDEYVPVYIAVNKMGLKADGKTIVEYGNKALSTYPFNNVPTGSLEFDLTQGNFEELVLSRSKYNNDIQKKQIQTLLENVMLIDDLTIDDPALAIDYLDIVDYSFDPSKEKSEEINVVGEVESAEEASSNIANEILDLVNNAETATLNENIPNSSADTIMLGQNSQEQTRDEEIQESIMDPTNKIDEILFNSYTESTKLFSNFYPSEITYNGVTYPTAEHAFQAAKTNDQIIKELFSTSAKPVLTAEQAKKLGKNILLRSDWESAKVNIMKDILILKFADSGLKNALLETKDTDLIHLSDLDTFWGRTKDGVGQNKLGVLLMQVRNFYKNNTDLAVVNKIENNDVAEPVVVLDSPNIINIGGNDINLTEIGINFTPNEQQIKAINDIYNWATKPDGEIAYTLEGYAGTGKSSIMKIVDHALSKHFEDVVAVAPTHQAKGVLSRFMNKVATTVHSLLGLGPNVELENFSIANLQFKQTNSRKMEDISNVLFIIDEASMINDDLVKYIVTKIGEHNSKVLFVGDPKQINPVNQDNISSAFLQFDKSVLTKIERQRGGNPLIDRATKIREDQDSSIHIPRYYEPEFNEFGKGFVVSRVGVPEDRAAISKFIHDSFSSQEFKDNPRLIRLLAWKNDTVNKFNIGLRSRVLGFVSPIEDGEVLKTYDRVGNFQNSTELLVTGIEKDVTFDANKEFAINLDNIELKVDRIKLVSIDDIDVDIDVDIDDETNEISVFTDKSKIKDVEKAFVALYQKYEDMIDGLYMSFRRGDITKGTYYYSLYEINAYKLSAARSVATMFDVRGNLLQGRVISKAELAANPDWYKQPLKARTNRDTLLKKKSLDYGYASTVHKAQGSTYKYVVIQQDDIQDNPNYTERMRIMYTAVTRASDVAVVQSSQSISNPELTPTKFIENLERIKNEYNSDKMNKCRKK